METASWVRGLLFRATEMLWNHIKVMLLSCYVISNSDSTDHSPAGLHCPWDFPGKSTGVGCHFLDQGIFPGQGPNPCLLHWQAGSLPLSPQGGPVKRWLHTHLV